MNTTLPASFVQPRSQRLEGVANQFDPKGMDPDNNSGDSTAPRPYRSKKRHPCDHCRRRKAGCLIEDGQTECNACRHQSRACTFNSGPPTKKRHRVDKAQPVQVTPGPVSPDLVSPGPSGPSPGAVSRHSTANFSTPSAAFSFPGHPAAPLTDIPLGNFAPTPPGGPTLTSGPGMTSLYAGSSSDQDYYLLRHLPFDSTKRFGNANWTVWNAGSSPSSSSIFTIYPNNLLDSGDAIYDITKVEEFVQPHQSTLLDLYYAYVHPMLPILEQRRQLETSIAERTLPASLLAVIYSIAYEFWSNNPESGPMPDFPRQAISEFAFHLLMLETRTPSLRTVQTFLLFLQCPPLCVREPNHPGFWAMTSQLVAVAQDIGLHVDSQKWDLPKQEKKKRRVLWWAVYMQDKWLAHWLGRPSHIRDSQYKVEPLALDDFTNDWGILDGTLSSSIQSFINHVHLTKVLATVLDCFYTIAEPSGDMAADEALRRASKCQDQLDAWHSQHDVLPFMQSVSINDFTVVIAYYGIAISIQRALFTCAGGTSYYDVSKENLLFQDIFGVFNALLRKDPEGLWLSYCKSNVAIIGSFIITALLSSRNEEDYDMRKTILGEYQQLLTSLAGKYGFASLPAVRLGLLAQSFSPVDLNG